MLVQCFCIAQVVLEAIELDNTFDAVQSSNDPYDRRFLERPVTNDNTKLLHPPRPGPINNSGLIHHNHSKVYNKHHYIAIKIYPDILYFTIACILIMILFQQI